MDAVGTVSLKDWHYELSGDRHSALLSWGLAMKPRVIVLDDQRRSGSATAEEIMGVVAISEERMESRLSSSSIGLIWWKVRRADCGNGSPGRIVADGTYEDVLDAEFDR